MFFAASTVLLGQSAATPDLALGKPTDDELFSKASCIVMGRLSEKVSDIAGDRSAEIEKVTPLLMRTMPSEGWPGSISGFGLHLTDGDDV